MCTSIRYQFSYAHFKMISPANVVRIFADRASSLSSIICNDVTSAATITNRECEVADDEVIDDECEDTAEETWDPNCNDDDNDDDEEKTLCKQFSLDYIVKAVEFYDEINPQTRKR